MDTQQLFDAIKVIADEAISEAGIDKTITASIISGPEANGAYLVEYFLEKLECFPLGLVKYSPGDLVYVKILEGDFSKKKIIQGLTSMKTDALDDSLGSVVVGDGYNYLVSPRDHRLTTKTHSIQVESRLVDRANEKDISHIRISSEIFSNFDKVMTGVDFGIRLYLNRQKGGQVQLELNRANIFGNFQKLNGIKQSVIFEIADIQDFRSVKAEYFTNDNSGTISFLNSSVDLINSEFANAVIKKEYEITIEKDGTNLKCRVFNEKLGELDKEGKSFKYKWFSSRYEANGTKVKTVIGESLLNKLPISSVVGKYCEVEVETIL